MQPLRNSLFLEFPAVPDSTVRTVCSYCGVGCGIVLTVRDGSVVSVAGDKEHPANFGRLCTKGATSHEMLAAPGRLTTALVRADREAPAEPTDVDRTRCRSTSPAISPWRPST